MLYKYAESMDEPTKPTNYAAGGAAAGAAVGVGKGLKKMMGPKKILNPNLAETGEKMIKAPLGQRLGKMGKGVVAEGGLKRLGKAGLIGAGIGLAGGAVLNSINKGTDERNASEQYMFSKTANSSNIKTMFDAGAADEILSGIVEKRKMNSFLRDIDCEVCGYKGKPTDIGTCPVCGATLGVDESKSYIPQQKPYAPYDGFPTLGVSAVEQAMMDTMITQASSYSNLLEKYGMVSGAVKESLSANEHDGWSRWMRHLFDKSVENNDGTVTIPKKSVDRWKRQMNTDYADLSRSEKVSDRKEVSTFLDVLKDSNLSLEKSAMANKFSKVWHQYG